MSHKTTDKHFAIFKKEVDRWVPKLGVSDWRIEFDHNDDEDSSRAWYSILIDDKVAELFLTVGWEDKITEKRIRRSGFHEVMHVRLARIEEMLMARGYKEEEVSQALHEIIYVFENLFYGSD